MRARIERDALRRALRTVAPAIPAKGSLAILSGVHIAAGRGLTFTGTDLQLTITAHADAQADEGSLVVSHRLVSAFADRAPDGAVVIELDEENVRVTAGESTAAFRSLPVTEWPRVDPASGDTFTLTAEHVDRIRRILPFASVDDARPILTGVLLGEGRAAATDSYRLAEATLDGIDVPPVLVPAPALKAALKDAEGELQISAEEHRATISHGGATWTTVLLEGEYPPYNRLMRDESPFALTVNAERLTDALGRMGVLQGDNTTLIERDGDKALVTASVADLGDVADVVPCSGDIDFRVGFNPSFLADLLTAAGTEEVTLGFVDALKPVTCDVDGLRLLQMPVRKS